MRRMTLVLVAVVCALSVAGVASGATTLRLTSDPHGALKYNKKVLKAKAGKVTIVMRNLAPLPHDIAIKGHGVNVKGKIVTMGKTSTVSAVLKKGRYEFYCSVPGHEAAGMKGTLIIT